MQQDRAQQDKLKKIVKDELLTAHLKYQAPYSLGETLTSLVRGRDSVQAKRDASLEATRENLKIFAALEGVTFPRWSSTDSGETLRAAAKQLNAPKRGLERLAATFGFEAAIERRRAANMIRVEAAVDMLGRHQERQDRILEDKIQLVRAPEGSVPDLGGNEKAQVEHHITSRADAPLGQSQFMSDAETRGGKIGDNVRAGEVSQIEQDADRATDHALKNGQAVRFGENMPEREEAQIASHSVQEPEHEMDRIYADHLDQLQTMRPGVAALRDGHTVIFGDDTLGHQVTQCALQQAIAERGLGSGHDLEQMHHGKRWTHVNSRLVDGDLKHSFRHESHPRGGRYEFTVQGAPLAELGELDQLFEGPAKAWSKLDDDAKVALMERHIEQPDKFPHPFEPQIRGEIAALAAVAARHNLVDQIRAGKEETQAVPLAQDREEVASLGR